MDQRDAVLELAHRLYRTWLSGHTPAEDLMVELGRLLEEKAGGDVGEGHALSRRTEVNRGN